MDELESFLEKTKELDKEIYDAFYNELEEDREPIFDGALNPERYFENHVNNVSPKIMWLMKEPYDEEDGSGGGWGFAQMFKIGRFPKDIVFGGSKPTWQPVVYITYGLLNDYAYWDEMDYIRNNYKMMEVLDNISWVNIQKLPSKQYNNTNMGHIYEAYEKHKALLHKQINFLNPDVIICGGTFNIVCSDFDCVYKGTVGNADYYKANNRVVIDAYHPAKRLNRENYVDSVINAVKAGLELQ